MKKVSKRIDFNKLTENELRRVDAVRLRGGRAQKLDNSDTVDGSSFDEVTLLADDAIR